MGNVCCCRSRAASNECGGAGTANSPADSSNDSDAHASNVDAESVAPADVATIPPYASKRKLSREEQKLQQQVYQEKLEGRQGGRLRGGG